MCLIAFAIGLDADRPLLLAANRDEYFERPTEPLHRWALPDGTSVIAGRDLRDGGTWLGVSEAGRVAMLTTVRSANPGSGRRSRGELTTRWLQSSTSWEGLLASIDPADYGGFNLVVGDLGTNVWAWIGNRSPDHPHRDLPALHQRRLAPGVYGVSNATLDTPWPKTLRLKEALSSALQPQDNSTDRLIQALADPQRPTPQSLPNTGVPPEIEHALSSPFVDMAERGYGTRSSLVADVRRSARGWSATLSEWTHAPEPGKPHRWRPQTPLTLRLG